MRILHVVPWFPPAWAWGGPVKVAYDLSKELVKRGHEVTVYTTDSLDPDSRVNLPPNRPLDLEGIRVYYFRNLSNWLAGKHHIQLSPSLVKVARDNLKGFDVIHLHAHRALPNIAIYHYARKYGIPYVLHAHGTLPITMIKPRLKWVYDIFWGRRMLKHVSKIIVLGPTEVTHCISMGVNEDRIEIMPNGVDLSEFANLPAKGNFKHRYNLGKDDKLILYLGRIHQSKGIDLLVEAFAGLSKGRDNIKLAIVGPDDGHLSALKMLIKDLGINQDKVLLTGPIYAEDKLEAYVDADVSVTPCFVGSPVTFVEACACGVPTITTQAGDNLDWLDGQIGLVVPYDKLELQEAIRHMLSDDKMRQRFSEQGRRLVQERFNWGRITDQLEEIYATVTGKGNR
jgi:glycosyltransferase involved in cell wall biosynthesis